VVARSRTIGSVVVAVLVAPVIAQVALLSPSDARPAVIVRPQPSPAATFPARPSLALPIPEAATGKGIPIPAAATGKGLPIPELLSRMPRLDGRLPEHQVTGGSLVGQRRTVRAELHSLRAASLRTRVASLVAGRRRDAINGGKGESPGSVT
jgi:hypothetical protein